MSGGPDRAERVYPHIRTNLLLERRDDFPAPLREHYLRQLVDQGDAAG